MRALAPLRDVREEKIFRLGRVTIEGDLIEFEEEGPLAFDADRRDIVSVGVYYDYRESTEDRERTRIRLTAQLDGEKAETFEAIIGDSPALNDSRRGFLSVPVRVPARGELAGRFVVEADYESGPWARAASDVQARERREGRFVLRVS